MVLPLEIFLWLSAYLCLSKAGNFVRDLIDYFCNSSFRRLSSSSSSSSSSCKTPSMRSLPHSSPGYGSVTTTPPHHPSLVTAFSSSLSLSATMASFRCISLSLSLLHPAYAIDVTTFRLSRHVLGVRPRAFPAILETLQLSTVQPSFSQGPMPLPCRSSFCSLILR